MPSWAAGRQKNFSTYSLKQRLGVVSEMKARSRLEPRTLPRINVSAALMPLVRITGRRSIVITRIWPLPLSKQNLQQFPRRFVPDPSIRDADQLRLLRCDPSQHRSLILFWFVVLLNGHWQVPSNNCPPVHSQPSTQFGSLLRNPKRRSPYRMRMSSQQLHSSPNFTRFDLPKVNSTICSCAT
jgi:hypothetical protein